MDVHNLNVGIVFQVLAQFRNIHIHAASVEVSITAPDFFQCFLAWQQVILVLCQHFQQIIFLG